MEDSPAQPAPARRPFGFAELDAHAHESAVAGVFATAAGHYDLLNDAMSLGLHRLWKREMVLLAQARRGQRWLDLACGSGDLAQLLLASGCAVVAADPSAPMLKLARERLGDRIEDYVSCHAEKLPFAAGAFDGVACAFGLRNFSDPPAGVAEIARVLAPGGHCVIMEFAEPWAPLRPLYRRYLLEALPELGAALADDRASYRYLGESILAHPKRAVVAGWLAGAGLAGIDWVNLAAGIVAVHRGWRAL